ncbi:MAG: hypothetical protein N4A47_07145 [Clostridia bacterium]|nr:hypothetical protein [Clostridia bacterium]
MKRLFRISFDILATSIIPILTWFFLSKIVKNEVIEIFTLTYPMQFIVGIIVSLFATSANISREKDGIEGSVMSSIIVGIVIGGLITLAIVINIEDYLDFMNTRGYIYTIFTRYAVIQMFLQCILSLVLTKLYYEGREDRANVYTVIFNIMSFVSIIGLNLILKDYVSAIIASLIIVGLYTFIILIKESEKFKIELSVESLFKYDSVKLCSQIFFVVIYIFGIENIVSFDREYIIAMTYVALVTDVAWDAISSIGVVAKIDISKNKFNIKHHFKNAYILNFILIALSAVMLISLYYTYKFNIKLVMIYYFAEILILIIYPIYCIKIIYLQLEYSATKMTTNRFITNTIRTAASFLATPFCTIIGMVVSDFYQFFTVNYIFNKNYYVDDIGEVKKKEKGILTEAL